MTPQNIDPEKKEYFIVRLRGGLGNQLFQYAAARIYNQRTGLPFKVDITGYSNPELQRVPRGYKLDNFNINVEIATEEEVLKYKYPYGKLSWIWRGIKSKIFKLDYLDYHPNYFKKPIRYMDGYFQSPLYYKGYEEMIQSECSVRFDKISDKAKEVQALMNTERSVSVHIRRGDLVTEIDAAKAQGLCSLQYYDKALGRMDAEVTMISTKNPSGEKPRYFIFSDDIYWVKKNMSFPEDTVYVSMLGLQDFEELYLMSKSAHNIIGNSTFSWWGAWLNQNPEKIVIAPAQWSMNNSEHPTILPERWIKL